MNFGNEKASQVFELLVISEMHRIIEPKILLSSPTSPSSVAV